MLNAAVRNWVLKEVTETRWDFIHIKNKSSTSLVLHLAVPLVGEVLWHRLCVL